MNIPEHSGPKLLPWQLDGEIWWGLLGTLLLPGAQTHPANPLPTVPLWCNVAEMFYLPVSELLKDSTLTNAGFPEIRLRSHGAVCSPALFPVSRRCRGPSNASVPLLYFPCNKTRSQHKRLFSSPFFLPVSDTPAPPPSTPSIPTKTRTLSCLPLYF